MLRRTVIFTIALLMLMQGALFAEGWVPPEEEEPSVLTESIDEDAVLPLGILSITAAAAGLGVTAAGLYGIFSNIANGYDSTGLQSGIILSLSGGILTAAASIVFGFILQE